jgi:hypothetical protein
MDDLTTTLAALPAEQKHRLACDCLERALSIFGPEWAPEAWAAVAATRRWLEGGMDPAALDDCSTQLWELVPGRGMYSNVSLEPTLESLPAWAAAKLSDWRRADLDDVFHKAPWIAASGALRAAKEAVFAAARGSAPVAAAAEIARAAAIAATAVVGERLRHREADAERDRFLSAAPLPADDWYAGLDRAVLGAETRWLERYLLGA